MEDEARFAATPDRAPERAALPPRTGRQHSPGVRARPPSEASPLRDSAGITPASLGTAPPGRRGTQAAGSLSQPEGPRGRWLTRRGTWDAWGADAGRGVSLRGRAGQWRNNELQASPGMSWRGLDSARGRIADEWPPVIAAPFPFLAALPLTYCSQHVTRCAMLSIVMQTRAARVPPSSRRPWVI